MKKFVILSLLLLCGCYRSEYQWSWSLPRGATNIKSIDAMNVEFDFRGRHYLAVKPQGEHGITIFEINKQ